MAEDEPLVRLERWNGPVDPDDPDANFKAEVAAYTQLDPLTTLARLAENLDLPVGALVRYVLTRWATAGSEGLLELGTSAVARLTEVIARAEEAGTELAKLEAYEVLKQQVSWLQHGLEQPEATYPTGGAGPRRTTRLAAYGVIVDAGRMLLCRVAPGFPGEGRWTLPGGGLHFGEDPADAVLREIHEETGLEARLGPLLEVDARHISAEQTASGEHLHWIRLLFAAHVPGDVAPHVVDVEGSTDDVRWFAPGELNEIELLELGRLGVELADLSG